MLILPIRTDTCVDLLIVLEDDNLERIKERDPAEVKWADIPHGPLELRFINITYASPEEVAEISRMAQDTNAANRMQKIVELLTRGWRYRPEAGDHDFGPVSLKRKPS